MNNLIKLIVSFFIIAINVSNVLAGPIIVRPVVVRAPVVKPVTPKPPVATKMHTTKIVNTPTSVPPAYEKTTPAIHAYLPWWAIAIANQRATYNEWWESDPNKKDIPKK
jgi:hypothetical protein